MEIHFLSHVIWGSPQLTLYTIVYSLDTSPFPLSTTARFLCSRSMKSVPSRFCNDLAFTSCDFRHWRQIPLFSTQHLHKSRLLSTPITQYLTPIPQIYFLLRLFCSVCVMKRRRYPLLKVNYVHRDVITNLDPKSSNSNRFNAWTPIRPDNGPRDPGVLRVPLYSTLFQM